MMNRFLLRTVSLSMLRGPLALTGTAAGEATVSAKSATPVAIVHATVIDATGRPPMPDAVLVMSGGRIAAVGPATSVAVPRNAKIIDARGKYLIPGLMDANVHLDLNADVDSLIRFRGRYSQIIIEGAQIALKSGQTTVFDTWGP